MTSMDGTTSKIAQKLKEIRVSSGMTQSEVAAKAKMNVNYYAKVERAEQKPSVEIYERIAKALEVTAADIFPF